MNSRRKFIGTVASGLASTLLGANERIRIGLIGAGARGADLARQALSFPDVQIAAVADVYTRRLEESRTLLPEALHFDYRALLDDKTIDAVIIATPQHLHCEPMVDALNAGKHVYVERTMAFTVEQAKRMVAAQQSSRRVVQVGHQSCSSGHVLDARQFLENGQVGRITAIHMHNFRNTPHGRPQWARPVYPEMGLDTIAWDFFDGEREFDANRYINWRYFWDYSGGGVHENLSQQLAFWYKTLNLQIPKSVTMSGGIYLWRDGREVPDTMHVSLQQPEDLLISWDSGFGNNQLGVTEEVLGTDGTITRGQQIRYLPQKVNRPEGAELLGRTSTTPNAHLQNFLESVRTGSQPSCPAELGYRVSVACRMAVESYLQQRTVRWDVSKEEIV
jgi:predicted dehydrogenase